MQKCSSPLIEQKSIFGFLACFKSQIESFRQVVDTHMTRLVSYKENDSFISTMTPQEIHDVVFQVDPSKAVGSNRFGVGFFHKHWPMKPQTVFSIFPRRHNTKGS